MRTSNSIKTFTLTLLFVILTACSSMQQKQSLPPIRVGYTFWWGDFTLLVAKEKGFFNKYGVNVEPVYYDVYSDSFIDLAAGQIDASLIAVGETMSISRHTPIKVIAVSDDGGYVPIVASQNIFGVRELKGKTIGTVLGTLYEQPVFDMLKSVGLSVTDVNIINIDPENVPAAIANNQIQAGLTWEPATTQALQNGAHVIYPSNDTTRLFPDGVTFRASVIQQRPEEIHAFMKAWFEAVDYRLKNPEETRAIAAKYLGVSADEVEPDDKLKIMTYADNLTLFDPSNESANSINHIANSTADYLIAVGALIERPNLSSLLDPQYFIVP